MGTMAEKLNKVIENKDAIKQALETPSNVMSEYSKWIEKYVQNQPTNTVTDGVCTNALDVPLVSMGVDGQSEQKQYSGKNFYNNTISSRTTGNLDLIANNDGTIIINGTNNENNLVFNSNRFSLKAGTYIASGMPEGTSTSTVYIQFSYQDENGNTPYITADNRTFTVSKDVDNFICFIGVKSGVTANKIILKPMIRLASITDDTYEPYVGGQPSPNPEYPQNVEVIDGVNLWDEEYPNIGLGLTYLPINIGKGEFTLSTNTPISNSSACLFLLSGNVTSGASYANNVYLGQNRSVESVNGYVTIAYRIVSDTNPKNYKTMLTKGTTPKPYLPHGCIGLEQSGKNLLDISEKNVSTTNVTPIMNFDNQKVTITTTGSSGIWFYVPCEANKTYKIIYDFIGTITNIRAYKKDKSTFITGSGTDTPSTQKSLNVTTNEDGFYFRLWVVNTTITLTKAQVSEDDTYEPYHSPKLYPINLNGNTLAKVGTVRDKLKIYRSGKVELIKNVAKYIFTGNENLGLVQNGTEYRRFEFQHNFPNVNSNITLRMNNLFKNSALKETEEEIMNIGTWGNYYMSKSWFVWNDNQNVISSLEEFRQFIISNNLTQYYALAESQTIELPPIEPIELWEGTNNFKLITNLDTTFEVEYIVKV